MRLIVCRICGDDVSFVCPVRFRRTYMRSHVERAHSLSADGTKLARERRFSDAGVVEWYTLIDGTRTNVFTEFEVTVPPRLRSSERNSAAYRSTVQPPSAERLAMEARELYASREGSRPAI